jgi:hypothetical protein
VSLIEGRFVRTRFSTIRTLIDLLKDHGIRDPAYQALRQRDRELVEQLLKEGAA